ncbi:MAG: alpha/beta hydrolase [Erysipelotrichaceae bacterium]|nr:alpha/beta hydrolase [Erysipelotrichaceae bacterium]MDY5251359.1 alpha/beta hydrolase [Erysipelotrichaceae bacterium]
MDINDKIERLKDFFASNKYELTPYLLPKGEAKPFVLILPGGGYGLVMSSVEGKPYALKLNAAGYNAFVLRYGIKKRARYPIPLDDVAKALNYIFANAQAFNICIDRYAIWGSSAGGHLAAMFATKKLGYVHYNLPKPACLTLCYPVITAIGPTHIPSIDMIIGLKWTKDKQRMVSVECNMDEDFPPTFIWNSLQDNIVPVKNSEIFAQKCQELHIPYEYVQYPQGHHGKGLKENADWFDKALMFCQKYL